MLVREGRYARRLFIPGISLFFSCIKCAGSFIQRQTYKSSRQRPRQTRSSGHPSKLSAPVNDFLSYVISCAPSGSDDFSILLLSSSGLLFVRTIACARWHLIQLAKLRSSRNAVRIALGSCVCNKLSFALILILHLQRQLHLFDSAR
jgi:hypothetical protein